MLLSDSSASGLGGCRREESRHAARYTARMTPTLYFMTLALSAPLSAAAPRETGTTSIGMRLVRVAPGEFVMGSGDAPPASTDLWARRNYDESPAHKVKITKAFYFGSTEVTNA